MNDDNKPPTWGLARLAIPKDLWPLLHPGNIEIHLYARLKQEGVIYSTSKTHKGNSQIFFYPDGDRTLAPVVGFIQYIYSEGKKSNKTLLAIKCAITVDKSITDPLPNTCIGPCNCIIQVWISHVSVFHQNGSLDILWDGMSALSIWLFFFSAG